MFLVIITDFEQLNSTKTITWLLNPVTTNAYIRGVCNQIIHISQVCTFHKMTPFSYETYCAIWENILLHCSLLIASSLKLTLQK